MRLTKNEKIVFLLLTIIAISSYFTGLDYIISDFIGTGFSVELCLFFSYTYYFIYMVVVAIFFFIKDERALLAFVLHIVIISIIHFSFTTFLPRVRPPMASRSGPLLDEIYEHGYASSFPSGHAAIAVSGYTLFCETGLPRWSIFVAGFPIIFTRLLMNHHYLSDTIAGILMGYLITKLLYSVFKKYHYKHFIVNKLKNIRKERKESQR